ncbi:MAG: HAMP domain-containing histidine kinase [Saprospiraceae bacterium]|nr:HAMP domain-containing histidine kinase [Saprospiraceae bacterium]
MLNRMFARITQWPTLAWTLVLGLLLASQFIWIRNSKRILEEQFENRAIMALCTAVEDLTEECIDFQETQCSDRCFAADDLANGMVDQFDEAVRKAVTFYNLPEEWELSFCDDIAQAEHGCDLCCSVLPMEESAVGVALTFPERDQLIYAKMKLPIISSLMTVLLVMFVFQYALRRYRLAAQTYQINQSYYNNIGHELRTPLTNIKLATKLLRKRGVDQEKYLDVIEREGKHMEEHTEKMLYLAALEDGTYELNKESIQVDEILDQVCQDMALQINDSQLKLSVECPEHVFLHADRYHLKNAISSLIDNCIKYVKDQPELRIEVLENADAVTLAFSDNGHGIAASDQHFIFDKYYRANQAERGYGLGLPYVKMIVEAHRGAVRLISGVGRGCRFLLSFPKLTTT